MASMDMSRRELLRRAALLGGIGAGAERLNAEVSGVAKTSAYRAQMAAIPIEEVKLTNLISMFSGPGGNVIVRHGEFDKILVDSFVLGAFPAFKKRLDAMGDAPILFVINTNWLFDHTDNNESFRKWRRSKSSRMRTPSSACQNRTIASECTLTRRQRARCRRRLLQLTTTSSGGTPRLRGIHRLGTRSARA